VKIGVGKKIPGNRFERAKIPLLLIMVGMQTHISVPTHQIAEFCQQHHIRKLALFGSALTEYFDADSDIDILVEFEPEHGVGFFGFVQIQDQLSEIFHRKVDLHTPMSLSRHFRQEVLRLAENMYEQAR
jgi:hypothetical protein